jgi:O-antigen ligase
MDILIFLFLVIFPFGQILRIGILSPIDVVVGMSAVYSIIKKQELPDFFKYLRPFLLIAGASWIFSVFLFQQITVLYGLLYLFRLAAYFYFGVYVWNFIKKKAGNKKLLLDSLLSLSLVSALLGWIQFFTFPDIKPFFVWGWDMHFLRIVGTFLDPTFLGLIIVFGLILSIYRYIDSKNWKDIVFTLFLLISLAFTYSRASYLAFIGALLVIIFLNKKLKKLLVLAAALILIAFILPTAKNHSIELFRTFSAVAKVENYQSTLKIFSKSPVFGVGYNNMCLANRKFIGFQDFSSHACSGSDSSLLFILATTGVVGLMIFVFSIWKVFKSLPRNRNLLILGVSFLALIIHSLFSNSMFYPWIMGWMIILLAEV